MKDSQDFHPPQKRNTSATPKTAHKTVPVLFQVLPDDISDSPITPCLNHTSALSDGN